MYFISSIGIDGLHERPCEFGMGLGGQDKGLMMLWDEILGIFAFSEMGKYLILECMELLEIEMEEIEVVVIGALL